MESNLRTYKKPYTDRIAFPMGGIGAGMVCLEGTGKISHVSVRHRPDVFNEPLVFSSITVKDGKPFLQAAAGTIAVDRFFYEA